MPFAVIFFLKNIDIVRHFVCNTIASSEVIPFIQMNLWYKQRVVVESIPQQQMSMMMYP